MSPEGTEKEISSEKASLWERYKQWVRDDWNKYWRPVPYRKPKWEDAERILGRKVPFAIIPREAGVFDVYIPQWDEIIHIRPVNTLPYNEQRMIKIMRYNRIVQSNVPMWARRVTEIMTWMDDVEDFLITIGAAIRLIGPKFPRYIKGTLGLIYLAADILNMFQIWRYFMPGGTSGKRAFESIEDMNPFGRRGKLGRARRISRKIPALSEWIEIAQTTDQMFGVGLCLGPIVGFTQEFLFSGLKDVRWLYNPNHKISALSAASRMCAMAPAFMHLGVYTEEEYLKAALAMAYCHATQRWGKDNINWDGETSFYFWKGAPNLKLFNPITVQILEERGHDVSAPMRFPVQGEPVELSFEHITPELAQDITNNMHNYADNATRGEFSLFLGASATSTIDDFLASFTGPGGGLELIRRKEGIMMSKIIEAGVSPPVEAPLKEWTDLWNMNRGFFARHKRNMTVKDYRKAAPNWPIYWVRNYRSFWGLGPEHIEIIGKPPTENYIQGIRDLLEKPDIELFEYEFKECLVSEMEKLMLEQEAHLDRLEFTGSDNFQGWVVERGPLLPP